MVQKFNPFVMNEYRFSGPRTMPETEWHRDLMLQLIATLKAHFADDPNVYVSGDMFVHYEPGNKRRHVAPDVFAVRGVRKDGQRPNYLVWEEGRAPEMVIELASDSTHANDTGKKFRLYRDVLKVKEYFLFDRKEINLTPSLQGFRLVDGAYRRIRAKDGRLSSRVLGLHLERDGENLRFWNPDTNRWIPTDAERVEDGIRRVEAEHRRADAERQRAEAERDRAEAERQRADAAEQELARLRAILAQRGQHSNGKNGTNGH